VISSVGFATQEISIGNQTSIDVALVASSQALNEVVVVGYGTVRKRDLTGSVASVQAKDFNKALLPPPISLIQGKVAGVQVLSNSGQPGGGTTVKVRGNSALVGTGSPYTYWTAFRWMAGPPDPASWFPTWVGPAPIRQIPPPLTPSTY